MKYRSYGKTGKKVSLLGFGGARFRNPKERFAENVDLVLKAVELGVNYFDTAPTYSDNISQSIIGTALAQVKGNVYIASKSHLRADPTADSVLRRISKSLHELKCEKITFFHMWSILDLEQFHQVIAPGGPLAGAIKAKEAGLIEHICVSTHCNNKEINEILNSYDFDGITLSFNALNYRYRIDGLKEAAKRNIGVAVMNPLGGGVIPRNMERFTVLGNEGVESVVDGALRFAVSEPAVSTCLVGITSLDELLAADKALSGDIYLPEELSNLYVQFDKFSQCELCTGCNYCAGCPKGLSPAKLMSVYNEYILSGNDIDVYRYKLAEMYGFDTMQIFDCIECGECERVCTQHLTIVKRITQINQWAEQELDTWRNTAKALFPDDKSIPVGIYAASLDAERLLSAYMQIYKKIDFPLFIFDSDSTKHGKMFSSTGLIVQSPDEIVSLGIQHVIVASKKYYNEISRQLKMCLPDNISIISI